jgi:hypothetical protein
MIVGYLPDEVARVNQSKETDDGLSKMGWYIRQLGDVLCVASIPLGLHCKKGEVHALILFFACFSILAGVSMFYFIARRLSERWRSEAVRSCFSPYIVGATAWPVMFVLLAVLSWLGR